MTKIDELIEKYTELHKAEQMVEAGEVMQDLKSLQEPTERVVEMKNTSQYNCCPNCHQPMIDINKYCPGCGAKIKWID